MKGQRVPCRFCGGADNDGHLFWECPFPPLVENREHPEFPDLIGMEKSSWPRCLLWRGWLPLFSGVNGRSPWAGSPWEGAANLLEFALGYSSDDLTVAAARKVATVPDFWTDGSLVDDKVSGASSAGAGCFANRCGHLWANWRWGHLDDDVGEDAVVTACRGFCSVPGPLQSVQRGEFWDVILALQANDGVHLGFDNLGVVRHVGRILDDKPASRPAGLVKDGDLILLLLDKMLRLRRLDTVRILEVKDHADEALVRAGGARDLDRLGNNGAAEAADFGCRRVPWWIIDARRDHSGVCARWRPVVLGLHARAVVNHDGEAGTSMGPKVWSVGSVPKRRWVVHAVRDRAFSAWSV